MAEAEQDPPALRFYQHVRDEVAEHRAVDEAEAVIAGVWVEELGELRRAALGQIAAMSVAEHVARQRLREAQEAGRPGDVARARAGIAAVEAERFDGLDGFRKLIARVDVALARADSAGLERSRRARRDLERLRSAWTGACEDTSSERG